jgi:hypothetical protein
MSSVSRSYGTAKAETKFVPCKSLTYYDNDSDHYVLVPFTVNNGVLDFVSGVTGFVPSNGEGDDIGFSWRMVKSMGGSQPVTSLSDNFKTWFASWIDDNEGETVVNNTISIFVAPVMTKVQQTVPSGGSILNSRYCLRYGLTEAPTSDQFVTGNDNNEYDTVWVFKTPLVISYKLQGDSTTYYASIYTQFTNPTGAY